MEASPVNTILHEWHFDRDFSDGAGTAKTLPFEGPLSFSTLVSRYAGDIPAGAMRATLERAKVLSQTADGLLCVTQPFFFSRKFDADSIREAAFSIRNLASTIVHNASLHQRADLSHEGKEQLSRLERGVWTERLSEEGVAKFKAWVEVAAPKFLEEANQLIGKTELGRSNLGSVPPRAVGVGVFYYDED